MLCVAQFGLEGNSKDDENEPKFKETSVIKACYKIKLFVIHNTFAIRPADLVPELGYNAIPGGINYLMRSQTAGFLLGPKQQPRCP